MSPILLLQNCCLLHYSLSYLHSYSGSTKSSFVHVNLHPGFCFFLQHVRVDELTWQPFKIWLIIFHLMQYFLSLLNYLMEIGTNTRASLDPTCHICWVAALIATLPTTVHSLYFRLFSKVHFFCFYEFIVWSNVKPETLMCDICWFSPVHETCYPVLKVNWLVLTCAFDKTTLDAIYLRMVF